jgi:hypothetical protein
MPKLLLVELMPKLSLSIQLQRGFRATCSTVTTVTGHHVSQGVITTMATSNVPACLEVERNATVLPYGSCTYSTAAILHRVQLGTCICTGHQTLMEGLLTHGVE